jgi:surface polysaccharide O-acyltransferase-like enzyme
MRRPQGVGRATSTDAPRLSFFHQSLTRGTVAFSIPMKPSVFETPTSNLYYKGDHEIISLQVLKALAAFAVVMLHTSFIFRTELMPICHNAVPLFFMITGYFLLNHEGILTTERLKRSMIKILKLALWSNTFYYLVHYVFHPEDLNLLSQEPLKQVFYIFVSGDQYAAPLWYLHSIFQVFVTLYIAVRFHKLQYIPLLTFTGLLINLTFGDYAIFWSDQPFLRFLSRNFLTIGLPSVYIGMCIRRFEHKITLTPHQLLYILLLLYVLLYVEACYILQWIEWGDVLFFTIPTSILTFVWVLKTSKWNHYHILCQIGRKDSLNIYILHLFIAHLLTGLHLYVDIISSIEVYIITLIFSVILRKAFSWIQTKWL